MSPKFSFSSLTLRYQTAPAPANGYRRELKSQDQAASFLIVVRMKLIFCDTSLESPNFQFCETCQWVSCQSLMEDSPHPSYVRVTTTLNAHRTG